MCSGCDSVVGNGAGVVVGSLVVDHVTTLSEIDVVLCHVVNLGEYPSWGVSGLSAAGDPTGDTVGLRRVKVICGSIIEPCLFISVIGMLPICSFSLSLTQLRPTSSSASSFLVVLVLIVDVSSDVDKPAATAAELTFPTMNPSTKMLETGFGVGEGGDMLLLLVVVLALVLLLVVVELLGVAVVIIRVVLVLTVVGALVGAVDVEVVATDEDLSVVITGSNLLGSGASVFLLGIFCRVGAGVGVVFCVTGAAGLGQRVVFFVGFSVV